MIITPFIKCCWITLARMKGGPRPSTAIILQTECRWSAREVPSEANKCWTRKRINCTKRKKKGKNPTEWGDVNPWSWEKRGEERRQEGEREGVWRRKRERERDRDWWINETEKADDARRRWRWVNADRDRKERNDWDEDRKKEKLSRKQRKRGNEIKRRTATQSLSPST